MSRRSEQFAAELRRAVQLVLARGLQDPRIGGLITVTAVRVTEDLRDATVSISVLPEEKQDLTLHGLQGAAVHIRREAAEHVNTRRLPNLTFKLDTSLKKEAAVIRALAQAAAEREHADPGTAFAPPERDSPSGGQNQ